MAGNQQPVYVRNGLLGELPSSILTTGAATPQANQRPIVTPPTLEPPNGPGVVNSRYTAALNLMNNPHVQAFLAMIRDLETGNRYDAVTGGIARANFLQHPNIYNPKTNSTSAGAYQFNRGTWGDEIGRLGPKDFSPLSQDVAATDLLTHLGATSRLLSGDVDGAIFAAGKRWDSLPVNYNNTSVKGHARSLATAKAVLKRDGG